MYRLLLILLSFCISYGCAYADEEKVKNLDKTASTPEKVQFVSYEQGWLDREGTIALKNVTNNTIKQLTFVVDYLDMNDVVLDYERFSFDTEIEPFKTKEINIPAYKHNRQYHYYKTKDDFGNPAFKIRFRLLNYKTDADEQDTLEKDPTSSIQYFPEKTGQSIFSDSSNLFLVIISIIACIAVLSFVIGLYVLVATMAKKRNRNVAVWVLLSIISSPILIMIILLAIGKDNRHDRNTC